MAATKKSKEPTSTGVDVAQSQRLGKEAAGKDAATKDSRDVTGMGFAVPNAPCTDGNCPFHGQLTLHGRRLSGVVSSARMRRTANITIESMVYLAKYERSQRRRSRLKAHNPECISAKEGDKVDVVECRPLSKTKHFVIVRKA